MTIIDSTLAKNNATNRGGAIYDNQARFISINSNYTNNGAKEGSAIFALGKVTLTNNRFVDNRAPANKETIDLYGRSTGTIIDNNVHEPIEHSISRQNVTIKDNQTTYNGENKSGTGIFENNVYDSTDISLKKKILSLKNNQMTYYYGEDVVLNFTIELEHPNYYDKDIQERLDDITLYINSNKFVTTKYENYTLSNLKPGTYSVYYNTCRSRSNIVKFTVKPISNWEELSEAVNNLKNRTKDTTFKLQNGTYINTGTINWINPNITLTIDGNGQTIDGNQLQAFNINGRSSLILKNITITNAKSMIGGAINNEGKLTVIQSVMSNNTAEYGGAIENLGTLTVTKSTLTGNTAEHGGANKTMDH